MNYNYGNTDMGPQGIIITMKKHKCNKLCSLLKLEKNARYDESK